MLPKTNLLLAALVILTPSALVGQSLDGICQAASQLHVGQWAEYHTTEGSPDGISTIRYAIIRMEAAEGLPQYRHEMKAEGRRGTIVLQLLVPGHPFTWDEIAGGHLKLPGQPAMLLIPEQAALVQLKRHDPLLEYRARCSEGKVLGWVDVEVPAGSFHSLHVRYDTDGLRADVWVSPQVPFGVVRAIGPDDEELVLIGHGNDAESSIQKRSTTN